MTTTAAQIATALTAATSPAATTPGKRKPPPAKTPAKKTSAPDSPAAPETPPPLHPAVAAFPWHYEVYHSALAPVLPALQKYLTAILTTRHPQPWFSLLGPSGIGKTYILRQALKCLDRVRLGDTWKVPTFTGRRGAQIAHIIPAEDLQDWRAPRDYAKYDVLYIEDIGSGSTLDTGAGKLLSNRVAELLQLRSGKWTLLCANLHRHAIAETLDHRIASRLIRDGATCLELPPEVPDYWEE